MAMNSNLGDIYTHKSEHILTALMWVLNKSKRKHQDIDFLTLGCTRKDNQHLLLAIYDSVSPIANKGYKGTALEALIGHKTPTLAGNVYSKANDIIGPRGDADVALTLVSTVHSG